MDNTEPAVDLGEVLENLYEIDKEDARHFHANNIEYKKVAEFKKGNQGLAGS